MPEEPQIQLIDYIQVIRAKSGLIIGGTLLFMVIAAAYFWGYTKPVFQAKASLFNISPKYQKFNTDVTSNALTMVSLQNLLESRDLIADVRKKMGWENTIKLDDLIKCLESKLVIEEDTNIRKTYAPIIEIYAEANSGADAAKLANTWAELFIQRYNELTQKVSAQTYEFIGNEYAATEEQLKLKQGELIKLKLELMGTKKRIASSRNLVSGYLSPSGSIETNLPQENIVEMLREKEIKGDQYNTEFSNKASMKVDIPPSTGLLESNHLIGYEGQLQDIELTIKELEAKRDAGASIKGELSGANARKTELINKIAKLKKDMSGLETTVSQQESKAASLEREVATLQSKFILLAKRKEEADIEKARLENTLKGGVAESDDIKVSSWAVPPEKKIGPKRVVGTLVAGIVGCLLFTLIAFFQNYMAVSSRRTANP